MITANKKDRFSVETRELGKLNFSKANMKLLTKGNAKVIRSFYITVVCGVT